MGTVMPTGGGDGLDVDVPRGSALGDSVRPRLDRQAPQPTATARKEKGDGLASFLGWFSLGLGFAQVAAPGMMSRLVGVDDDERSRRAMRALGLREISSGVGILTRERPAEWMWSRVAGDAMDLALLGRAMTSPENDRRRTLAATAAVLGVAALDVACARQLTKQKAEAPVSEKEKKTVTAMVTIRKPIDEVYAYWRDFERLPEFMRHLESVRVIDERRSHWVAKAPAGQSVEWDAEITADRPNELISWRSLEGADVENSGTVRFRKAPGDRGTEVIAEISYDPPAGKIGTLVAKLFREEPGQQAHDDLKNFKAVLETGEVVLSDASIHKGMHPARPAEQHVEV